jgi:hypothetical protein
MRHPANSWAVAVPVAAALAIGLGATALFDPASAGVAVVSLLEPFLLAAGLFGLAACLLSGARAIAGGLGVGLLLGFLALHNPGRLRLAEAELPGWSNQLRDCALVASSQPQPFRLLWWQVDGSPSPSALFTLLDARPDVVVLDGLSDPKLLDALGAKPRAGKTSKSRSAVVPHWDEDAREVRFQGKVVRVAKRPRQAHNIVKILRAFEAAGWPPRIDDPHRRKSTDETRRRDVSNLNKGLDTSLMKFECDGDGTGFLWKKIPQPKTAKSAKRRKR